MSELKNWNIHVPDVANVVGTNAVENCSCITIVLSSTDLNVCYKKFSNSILIFPLYARFVIDVLWG